MLSTHHMFHINADGKATSTACFKSATGTRHRSPSMHAAQRHSMHVSSRSPSSHASFLRISRGLAWSKPSMMADSVATASFPAPASAISKTIVNYPLTTRFEPPTSCFKPAITLSPGEVWRTWATDPVTSDWADLLVEQSTCYPASFVLDFDGNHPIYSPGVCPLGFTTAVQSEQVHEDGGTVTTATCCPR